MNRKADLSESLEDFLEIILDLERENKVARAKDIAERMNIQPGSVTGALKNLAEKKLINYAPYSFITLTEKGARIAKDVARRHRVLKDFLLRVLQLDEETAETTACRMEHAIDEQTMNRLVSFGEFLFQCPRMGDDWIQSFMEYCRSQKIDRQKCDKCLDTWKDRR